MPFKPTDLSGCVLWISPQGDPYQTTYQNGSGCFLDTSNAQACKDGDQVRQVKDLSSVADHMGIATAYRQPIYRSGGRHGPYLAFNPPNREVTYTENCVRARVTGISSTPANVTISTDDVYNGTGGACLPTNGSQTNFLDGIDSGWMYLRTSAATTAFSWAAGNTITWTDNAAKSKTATYTGVAEGMAYLNGTSRAVSSGGGISVYVVLRSKHTYTGSRASWFTHGNGGNFLFGCFPDASNSPKLMCFVGGVQKSCVNLSPSHSPQIYGVRADNTGITFSMGDLTETVASSTAVPTAAAIPRIGQYSPDTVNQWYGAGDYHAVIVYNRKLNSSEHAQVLAHLRSVCDIQEYTGLLTVAGYSIFAGENASDTRFWEKLDVERLGYEVRVNAYPGITQSQINTNVLATTGYGAFTAPYVNQSNYLPGRKYAILAALTNDYTATPGDVAAGMAALKTTITSLQSQGHKVILTTDVDKCYISNAPATTQWRADAASGNAQIRLLGLPVIDWGAAERLGTSGAAQNQQYFFVGYVHPNSAAQALMAAVAEPVVIRTLSKTVVRKPA